MKTLVFIRIYKDEKLVEVKQFTESQITIGSGETALVKLEDSSVSAIHAMIEERENGYFLNDLGSENGTFCNGQKVLDQAIDSGSLIQVGAFRLEFSQGVPKPKVATEAPAVVQVPVAPVAPVAKSSPTPITAVTNIPTQKIIEPMQPMVMTGTGTYAPPNQIEDLDQVLAPSRGNVIEVTTTWRGRILSTYHFSERKTVHLGGGTDNDIVLPIFGTSNAKYPLLKIDAQALIFVRLEPGGLVRKENQTLTFAELMGQNRLIAQSGGLYGLVLDQGESVRVDFANDVAIYVRYVNGAPKPVAAPLLDFTSTELTGLVMSFVLTAILGLYIALYSPPPKSDDMKDDDVMRTAVFNAPKFVVPKPPPTPPVKLEEPAPVAEKKVVKSETPQPEKKAAKAQTDKPEGAAAEAPKKPLDQNKPKKLTSVQHGGEIKTAPAPGANVKTVRPKDVTKMGLLGTLGSHGAQNQLNQASEGSGELAGLAAKANGMAGFDKDRPGDGGLGSPIKDDGRGGKGAGTVGISGVRGNGTGTGLRGNGQGGLGDKTGVSVQPGGSGESFDTQIDKEAIRRVVRSHLREIQHCYEAALNHDPSLAGKVLITWEIGPGGRVLSASVSQSTLSRAEVGDCLVARLKQWRFPDPPADKVPNVTYPFLFQKN